MYRVCMNFLWECDCSVVVNDPCDSVQNLFFFFFCLMVASWTDIVFRLIVENSWLIPFLQKSCLAYLFDHFLLIKIILNPWRYSYGISKRDPSEM